MRKVSDAGILKGAEMDMRKLEVDTHKETETQGSGDGNAQGRYQGSQASFCSCPPPPYFLLAYF